MFFSFSWLQFRCSCDVLTKKLQPRKREKHHSNKGSRPPKSRPGGFKSSLEPPKSSPNSSKMPFLKDSSLKKIEKQTRQSFSKPFWSNLASSWRPKRLQNQFQTWKIWCWKIIHFRHPFLKGSVIVLERFLVGLLAEKFMKIISKQF